MYAPDDDEPLYWIEANPLISTRSVTDMLGVEEASLRTYRNAVIELGELFASYRSGATGLPLFAVRLDLLIEQLQAHWDADTNARAMECVLQIEVINASVLEQGSKPSAEEQELIDRQLTTLTSLIWP